MSRRRPEAGCVDLGFRTPYPIDDPGEVALEDYARALTRARAAEAVRPAEDPARVHAVHVCGAGSEVTDALRTDLEDFARTLVAPPPGGGLGWS
jgi:hypothetical protein